MTLGQQLYGTVWNAKYDLNIIWKIVTIIIIIQNHDRTICASVKSTYEFELPSTIHTGTLLWIWTTTKLHSPKENIPMFSLRLTCPCSAYTKMFLDFPFKTAVICIPLGWPVCPWSVTFKSLIGIVSTGDGSYTWIKDRNKRILPWNRINTWLPAYVQ